jgi:NAD(P)-dependent dehydrogenase (short-subunit alcohol dehydrogenase family)
VSHQLGFDGLVNGANEPATGRDEISDGHTCRPGDGRIRRGWQGDRTQAGRGGVVTAIVGRDEANGARAVAQLIRDSGNSQVHFFPVDLSSVLDVDDFGSMFSARFPRIHILVHNAGVVVGRRELTREGIEKNFATNYLGRFALTERLTPSLIAGGTPELPARVLLISGAARGRIRFDDLSLARRFSTLRAVRQVCRANDVLVIELARRIMTRDGVRHVTTACLKLGVVKTGIRRTFPRWMKWLVPLVLDYGRVTGDTEVMTVLPSLGAIDRFPSDSATRWCTIKRWTIRSPRCLGARGTPSCRMDCARSQIGPQ